MVGRHVIARRGMPCRLLSPDAKHLARTSFRWPALPRRLASLRTVHREGWCLSERNSRGVPAWTFPQWNLAVGDHRVMSAMTLASTGSPENQSKTQTKRVAQLIAETKEWRESHGSVSSLAQSWQQALFHCPRVSRATYKTDPLAKLLFQSAITLTDWVKRLSENSDGPDEAKGVPWPAIEVAIQAWTRLAPVYFPAPFEGQRLTRGFESYPPEVAAALCALWTESQRHRQAPWKARKYWKEYVSMAASDEDRSSTGLAKLYQSVLFCHSYHGCVDEIQQFYSANKDVHDTAFNGSDNAELAWAVHLAISNINSLQPGSFDKAVQILENSMPSISRTGVDAELGSLLWKSLQSAVARYLNRNRSNPSLGQEALQRMLQFDEKHPDRILTEGRHVSSVMAAWARKGDVDKVQSWFPWWEENISKGHAMSLPVWNIVLSAQVHGNSLESLENAEALLDQLEKDYFLDDQGTALGDGRIATEEDDEHEEYDLKSSKPQAATNHSYNLLLQGYAKNPEVSDRVRKVENMLRRMQQMAQKTGNTAFEPDQVSFCSLLQALMMEIRKGLWRNMEAIVAFLEDEGESKDNLKPDITVYAILLNAYAQQMPDFDSSTRRRGDVIRSAVKRAEELWFRLEDRYHRGLSSFGPDTKLLNSLLGIYAKAPDPWKAESRLRESVVAYQEAVSHFDMGTWPEIAELPPRPDRTSFLTVMTAWRRAKDANISEASDHILGVYDLMKTRLPNTYEQVDDSDENTGLASSSWWCRPNMHVFRLVMFANSRAAKNSENRLDTARSLIVDMESLGLTPDQACWNSVFAAASFSRDEGQREQVWKYSWDLANHLYKTSLLNEHSYALLLSVCVSQTENEKARRNRVNQIVEMCRSDGYFNHPKVQRALANAGL